MLNYVKMADKGNVMENENLQRIMQISNKFRFLFSVLIFAVPILTVLFWLFFNQLSPGFKGDLPVTVDQPLTATAVMLCILVSLIPASIVVYAFTVLRQLFTLYGDGTIFAENNVKCYRHLGYALIYWAFSKIAFIPLISVVLTYSNPPGQRSLVLGFGSSDFATIMIGAIVLIISWVMREASRLEDEHAHTV